LDTSLGDWINNVQKDAVKAWGWKVLELQPTKGTLDEDFCDILVQLFHVLN
jgi:hypothetical protein